MGLGQEDIPVPVDTNNVVQEGTINPSCLGSQDPLWGEAVVTFHIVPFFFFFEVVTLCTLSIFFHYTPIVLPLFLMPVGAFWARAGPAKHIPSSCHK